MPGDTTRTRHLAEQRVGTRLDGKWFLDSLLGFGGSAAVYAATHRNGMRGAVKILHPHCVADEQLRTRFVREGYVANKIGHPGAVTVLDDDTASDGTVYLVMELLEGRSLERLRGDGQVMSVSEVIRVADDLLDVLIKAHAQGIIHRDIKPANIFVTHAGQLKVLDFGIARLGEPTSSLDGSPATQTGLMMGTPAFMPPEQARARWDEVDARSDLWAVGTTMIALMLGRRPRIADTPNEELLLAMTQAMPKVATLLPHVPRNIAYVFDRACEFNRNDRWPSAAVMQEALRAASRESEPTIAAAKDIAMGNSIAVPIITTTVVAPMTPQPAPLPPQFTATAAVPAQAPSGPSLLSPNTGPHPVISGLAASVVAPPASHHDMIESPPSLTTNRAVLHHTNPPPNKGAGRAVLISLVAVFAVVLIAGSGLYVKYNGLPMRQAPAATAAPSPPPPPPTSDSPPPPPTTADPPTVNGGVPNPPTTGPTSPATGPAAKTTAARPPQPAHPPPRPAASPQASAFFNDRF